MKKSNSDIVHMVVGKKVWQITRKMVNETIKLAKEKYRKENVNAIVAVEKKNVYTLLKDVYTDNEEFIKAISNWEHGGYTCYYIAKKG